MRGGFGRGAWFWASRLAIKHAREANSILRVVSLRAFANGKVPKAVVCLIRKLSEVEHDASTRRS